MKQNQKKRKTRILGNINKKKKIGIFFEALIRDEYNFKSILTKKTMGKIN